MSYLYIYIYTIIYIYSHIYIYIYTHVCIYITTNNFFILRAPHHRTSQKGVLLWGDPPWASLWTAESPALVPWGPCAIPTQLGFMDIPDGKSQDSTHQQILLLKMRREIIEVLSDLRMKSHDNPLWLEHPAAFTRDPDPVSIRTLEMPGRPVFCPQIGQTAAGKNCGRRTDWRQRFRDHFLKSIGSPQQCVGSEEFSVIWRMWREISPGLRDTVEPCGNKWPVVSDEPTQPQSLPSGNLT